jgi:GT2 family glycosyltransferase
MNAVAQTSKVDIASLAPSGSTAASTHDTKTWAVVIPSFNHVEDAITCLASLREAVQTPSRVILVDDASTEDAVAAIAAWAESLGIGHEIVDPAAAWAHENGQPWLTILASQVNSGFSVSCNIGLRYAHENTTAPFVLLVNNDAALSRSYFVELAAGMASVTNVGLVTGTIYEWDRHTVWFAGGRFNPLRAVAEHYLDVPTDGAARATEFVCGCTMLIARGVLDSVGFLPELYTPCYCEDADYSLQVARAGFRLVYVPRAHAYHRVSSSLGRERRSPNVIYWFNRNRGYAVRRNYKGWRRTAGIAYLAITKPARALWELAHGRPKAGAAFIRGTLAGFFDSITPRS